MIDIIVLIVLAVLVGVAYYKENPKLRIAVVIILLAILIERDMSIGPFVRSANWNLHLEGKWSEDFRDGTLAVFDFITATRVYLFANSAFILLLCVKGFRRPKPKLKTDKQDQSK